MNSRERFDAVMTYGPRDRPFQWEMQPYEETLRRWKQQGLPEDSSWDRYGDYDRFEWAPVRVHHFPLFEKKTLSVEGDYEIYRDEDGAIKKKLKDVPEPAMPQYLEYPLSGRDQWPAFRRRLDPASPARLPTFWESMKRQYADRDFVLALDLGVLERALDGMSYDCATFWEDMAYKTGPLLGPQHYRRIFLPQYRRIVDRLHRAGIRTIMLDSDGNVDELIPCWLDTGITCIYPMEVAAGMDVVALRRTYGRDLLMGGGMDKRVLAGSRDGIRRMVEEKRPLIEEGGYLPGCDHAIPPDVPWENYLCYRRLLAGSCA
jgi:hypothetical protein